MIYDKTELLARTKIKLKTFSVESPTTPLTGKVDDAAEAAKIAQRILADYDADRENFLVLAINARGAVIGYKVIATGTASACLVHPSMLFQAAIVLGANAIIHVHNHPSGDASPSSDDLKLHDRFLDGGELLGIPVIDGLVVTRDGRFSSLGGQNNRRRSIERACES